MPDDAFRLPISSYEEVAKIIRAYGASPEDASLTDVSKASAMNPTTISGNNAFLASVGLLEGGQRKRLTDPGKALAKALDYDVPQEIQKRWADVVDRTEFMQQILSAVRIRRGMELSALRIHVAYTAGQPKKPSVLTGAGTIVDILKAASRLIEQDNKLVAPLEAPGPRPEITPTAQAQQSMAEVADRGTEASLGHFTAPHRGLDIRLVVNVNVACGPDDLETVGTKLQALLEALRESAHLEPEHAPHSDS